MPNASFQDAVKKLMQDAAYRQDVAAGTANLADDFGLSPQDIQVLGNFAKAGGWLPAAAAQDIDLSHCCCCCGF